VLNYPQWFNESRIHIEGLHEIKDIYCGLVANVEWNEKKPWIAVTFGAPFLNKTNRLIENTISIHQV